MQNPELELYSINCKGIKEAASDLINNTAESLIRFIYASVLKNNEQDSEIKEDPTAMNENKNEDGSENGSENGNGSEHGSEHGSSAVADPTSPYLVPEIRIGLSIRILVKSYCSFEEDLVELILKDIEALRHDTDYLLSFPDPKARRRALEEEYTLVQGYIDLDDTLSLNQELGEETVVPSRGMYQMADRGGCTIQ